MWLALKASCCVHSARCLLVLYYRCYRKTDHQVAPGYSVCSVQSWLSFGVTGASGRAFDMSHCRNYLHFHIVSECYGRRLVALNNHWLTFTSILHTDTSVRIIEQIGLPPPPISTKLSSWKLVVVVTVYLYIYNLFWPILSSFADKTNRCFTPRPFSVLGFEFSASCIWASTASLRYISSLKYAFSM